MAPEIFVSQRALGCTRLLVVLIRDSLLDRNYQLYRANTLGFAHDERIVGNPDISVTSALPVIRQRTAFRKRSLLDGDTESLTHHVRGHASAYKQSNHGAFGISEQPEQPMTLVYLPPMLRRKAAFCCRA
jgi:hypothetical protein